MHANLFTFLCFLFLFCLKINAQSNMELRLKSVPPDCSNFPCILRLCFDSVQNCSNKHHFKLNETEEPISFLIPLDKQKFNFAISLQATKEATNIAKWSGRLTKQWQPLTGGYADVRLNCSNNFYGPTCLIHCFPRNSNQECDEETGQRRCIDGYRGVDCLEPVDCSKRCIHGKCSPSGECVCLPGYEGKDCRIRASTCNALKPCFNGGTCYNLKHGAYECRCTHGFDGPQCERKKMTCAYDNPCQNGGECQQDFGRPLQCICPPEFHGQFCQVQAKNCSSLPCQNGAQCVTIKDGFGCLCNDGYLGKICDQRQQKCTHTICNSGTCIEKTNTASGIECLCPPGWTGVNCEYAINSCHTSPCLNNGVCKLNATFYQCHCPIGYAGNHCEITIKTMELTANNSALTWIIFLLLAMLCIAFLIICCLGLIHLRYRRLSICLDSLLTNIGSYRQQIPKIKPPPRPLLHSQHFSSDQFLLKKSSDVEKAAMEMKPKETRHEVRILNADALCRNENLYLENPIRPVNSYASVDTLFGRYATVGYNKANNNLSINLPTQVKKDEEENYAEIK